jgi:hypothetical protein
MADVRELVERLVRLGVDPSEAAVTVAEAFVEGSRSVLPVRSKGAERTARWRHKASQSVTGDVSPPLMTKVPRPLKTLNPPPKTPLKGVKKVPRRAPGFLTDGSLRRAFGGTPRSEGSPEVGWSEKSSGLITSGAAKAAKTPPKSIGMQPGVIGA